MDELLTREYFEVLYEGERFFEEGNLIEAKHRFDQAQEIFSKVVTKERNKIEDYISKVNRQLIDINVSSGDELKSNGEIDAAREKYETAFSLCTSDAEKDEITIKMAKKPDDISNVNSSTTLMKLFAELDSSPDSPEILYNIATELAIEGYHMDSIRYLERLLILTPEDSDLHYKLGNALSDIKSYASSKRSYEKARELGYDKVEIEFRIGKISRFEGNHRIAVEHFRKALEYNDEHIDSLRALSSIYESDNKPNHAIECLEKIVTLDPEDVDAMFNVGELYESIGNGEKAAQWWKRVIDTDANSEAGKYAKDRLDEAE
jgi:tetratricopeptide (TPR) repeat protein